MSKKFVISFFYILIAINFSTILLANQKNIILKNISKFPVFYYEKENNYVNFIGFQGTHGTRTLNSLKIPPWTNLSKNLFKENINFFQFPNSKFNIPLKAKERLSQNEMKRLDLFYNYINENFKGKNIFIAHHYGGLSVVNYLNNFSERKLEGIILLSYPFSVDEISKDVSLSILDQLINQRDIPLLLIYHAEDNCTEIDIKNIKKFLFKKNTKNLSFELLNGGEKTKENLCSHRGYHGFMGVENKVSELIIKWLINNNIF
jgi:hypothetical protein